MENKILSLDLGSNSIGATIRDTADTDNQFKKTTVITFETGVGKDDKGKFTLSHAAERTSKRSVRRLYQSRRYKLWATLEKLSENGYCPIEEISLRRWKYYDKEEALKGNGGRAYPVNDTAFANWIKLDFDNNGQPDFTSPYELRKLLVTTPLNFSENENKHKLGRALYHIAQHRGFKSSKKVQNADSDEDEAIGEIYDKDKGAERKKRNKFWEAIEKLGFTKDEQKTVGQIFYAIEKRNKEQGTNTRIRNDLHQYVTRKMLMQEVETIFKVQNIKFGSIFYNKKTGIPLPISQSPMFWQKPLRSQKGTIGKCTLETNKYRCPESHPAFEEFRAWCFLNNIKYTIRGTKDAEPEQIPLEFRKELYNKKFFRRKTTEFKNNDKDFYFAEIADWVKKRNEHDNWQLNYDYKTNVSACPISSKLKDIFGEHWQDYTLKTEKTREGRNKGGLIKQHTVCYNINDIWHVLFDSDDEDFIEDFARKKLQLDDKKANKFLALYKSMPVSYAMLSLKAINNILPFLRQGFIYSEAALLAKVSKILGETHWAKEGDSILRSLKRQVIDKNRHEKKILNITNNLIAKYKVLPFDKKFAERDFYYQLGSADNQLEKNSLETDKSQILQAIEESYGKSTWHEKNTDEQGQIFTEVSKQYQSFFGDRERKFKKLPHLQLSMKRFLSDRFTFLYCPNILEDQPDEAQKCTCKACKKLNTLYHPSQIYIYPVAKEGFYKYNNIGKRMVMLGSPQTGAFKNPMALRALHELRKFVNYLIATDQVDEQTRVVVEIPRDGNLDDNNKRWAWSEYQAKRAQENKEFRDAIYELVKNTGANANHVSDSDIDKFRLWYEMIEGKDAEEGIEKEKTFNPLTKEILKKRNSKGIEEETEEFTENNYLRINKSLFFKLQKAKDNIQSKYQLWKEQGCTCMYTGEIIRITDLFNENLIDFEHTIPRSKSLDNSLANLTVCSADFNRNIKKNKIPYELDNYDKPAYGYTGCILDRLKKWEEKIEDLRLHVEFWKTKSKRGNKSKMISPGSNISEKDFAIRQRHLWEFELKYWEDKVYRFTMKEIKGGFRKSQLIDTQIISKYAMHYLRTYFNTVDVQKGVVTAEFRKIFGIQDTGIAKDRSKHTHHATDAIVLSVIPPPAIREQMLTIWYEIEEQKNLLKSNSEKDKKLIVGEISLLTENLEQLKYQCNLPKNLNNTIKGLDDQIVINNIAKDQALTISKKRIRHRGKLVPLKVGGDIVYKTDESGNNIQRTYKDGKLVFKNDELGQPLLDDRGNMIPVYVPKEKWAKGDGIRGQLHLDTLYGKIKKVQRDNNAKPIKDEFGNYLFAKENDGIVCVLRKEVNSNFNVEQIVDPHLKTIIMNQLNGRSIEKTMKEEGGLWMLKKDGSRAHKIRHIRCFEDKVTDPISLKQQTYKSNKDYKNSYWAKNGENIICALYQKTIIDKKGNKKSDRELEIITLKDAAALRSFDLIDEDKQIEIYRKDKNKKEIIDENNFKEKPFAILKPGMKVVFYDNDLGELKPQIKELQDDYYKRLSKRIYFIRKFYGAQIFFQHHLEARSDEQLKKDYPEKQVFKIDKKGNEITYGKRGINGFTESILDCEKLNKGIPWHRLLYSKDWLNIAIEGKDFEINPDGTIEWIKNANTQ